LKVETIMLPIILGSASKNRAKVLTDAGYTFTVLTADIDEKQVRHIDPLALTLLLAKAKAAAILPKVRVPSLLITSDQVVSFNGVIREKPGDVNEARHFLETLHECPNKCVSSVVVTNTQTLSQVVGQDAPMVYMNKLPSPIIDELIAEGRVLTQAGGFGIENPIIKPYIKSIEGELQSVMGLPLKLTQELLERVISS
jgi:septum formation protein